MPTPAKLPRGDRQREALVLAPFGPLGVVKSLKAQATALVKGGFLDEGLRVTDKGRAAIEVLTAVHVWGDPATPPLWMTEGTYFGTLSADGETAYVVRHGVSFSPVAFRAASIPPHITEALGLSTERESA